jgi:uncharacterized membrane protein SpoIIM required for sporulation
MKIADVLSQRRAQWQELDRLCTQLEHRRFRHRLQGATVSRFASLYRSACADLALADSYRLPPNTVQYLHQLVGRAHNQLYRARTFDYGAWGQLLLVDVPQRILRDGCVQLAFVLFWGFFAMSAWLAASPDWWPDYAQQVLGDAQIEELERSFASPIAGRDAAYNPLMASFYIYHNTGIGLKCFAGGLLVLPGLLVTVFNASILGASFGYMARPDVPAGANFFHFVTAHGPFELTAIVLSAGAGLRLGLAWLKTDGLARIDSLRRAADESMPLMGTAMLLFFLAALIEAFLSPSAAPYAVKATVAVICSGLLMFYFVVLGYPREESRAV